MALLSVDEALAQLLNAAEKYRTLQPSGQEALALLSARGHILAQDVIAPVAVPPARNSAMDGYAFRFADAQATSGLVISQRIPAGMAPVPLQTGTAARIFTGGLVPEGADTVEMQENCRESEGVVTLLQAPRLGANIRAAGEDIACGSMVLAAGTLLGPAQLGLLASLGLTTVSVFQRLRVALLCTGNELVPPGGVLQPGQLFNSNETLLTAVLHQQGCDVINLPPVADSLAATLQALAHAVASGAQLIMSTGGVSVGEEDHMRAAVQCMGQLDLWKVAIKPGKPLAFGSVQGIPFIGLPGNPQSVWVTSHVLALPFIRCLQGDLTVLSAFRVPAGFERQQPQARREYVRVRVVTDDQGQARLVAHPQQGSGALSSAAWADGLAIVEAGELVGLGQSLNVLLLK